jgi:hypothetical protein
MDSAKMISTLKRRKETFVEQHANFVKNEIKIVQIKTHLLIN